MKRFVLLLAAMLLLAFVPGNAASADYWLNLGTWNAGSEIFCSLSENDYGLSVPVSCEGFVPSGCAVGLSPVGDSSGLLMMSGFASDPGEYFFTLTAGEDVYHCSFSVSPAVPVVSISTDSNYCLTGSYVELTATASAADGGLLTYQWYQNGHAVPDGNWPTLTADSSLPGICSYYCIVTNTRNGVSSSVVSDALEITIEATQTDPTPEPELEAISVSAFPDKTHYYVDEQFDATGLQLEARYSNGMTEPIYSGFIISSVPFSAPGPKTIAVTYGGLLTTFEVNVDEPVKTLEIQALPYKTEYAVGDWVDTSGMQLLYINGHIVSVISTGFTTSPSRITEETGEIFVTYDGLTVSYPISVSARDEVRLAVKALPTRLQYQTGDRLDISGLVLEQSSGTGMRTHSVTITEGYSYEPVVLDQVGSQTITVRYGELQTSFSVTVNGPAMITPSPLSNTAPVSSGPSTPEVPLEATDDSDHTVSQHTGMVLFIAFIAVLSLAILGVYVYIARTENFFDTVLGQQVQRWFDKFTRR